MTSLGLLSFIKIDMKVDERHRNPEIKRLKAYGGLFWARNKSTEPRTSELVDFQLSILQDAKEEEQLRPAVPTLPCVDEGPHRTGYDKVQARCACCQWASPGLTSRALVVAGRLGSLDACSKQDRGGRHAPPRHTSVLSIFLKPPRDTR